MPAFVKSKLLLYADDSGIFESGKDKKEVEKQPTDDLKIS